MSSTTLEPLAQSIATLLSGLAVTPTLKAYAHDPGLAGLSTLPCAIVHIPEIRRVGVDIAESQLGARDWFITYGVTLYFDLRVAQTTAQQAIEYVEAFVKAVDTESLQVADPTVLDAKVIEAIPAEYVDQDRPMLAYECRLEIFKLV